jgi:hypothetical protein
MHNNANTLHVLYWIHVNAISKPIPFLERTFLFASRDSSGSL